MDNDNSLEGDRRRFRFWLAGIVLTMLALALLGWLSRPIYRQFKEQRAQARAQAFLAKGDFSSARLSALQAISLNPTNLPACRVMAALADLAHNSAALDWQLRIVKTDPSTENQLQLALTALRYQSAPFPLATQILEALSPKATNLAAYQVTAATLALRLHHLNDAEVHFEMAARLEPTNQLFALNLAVIRLACTNEIKATAARATLESFRSDANLGPPALRALVVDRLAKKDAAMAESYSTQLLASAAAALTDQLQHLEILRQLHPAAATTRLQAIQQNATTNAVSTLQVAEWMQANGLVKEEVSWLTNLPSAFRLQPQVRLALTDAYLETADWQALHELTSHDDWGEMNYLRLALAAHAWSQLGAQPSADSNWRSAILEAGNHYGALTTLLGLAERWRLPRERELLLEHIVEAFPQEKRASLLLKELYVAEGRTVDLNALCAKLFAVSTNVEQKNDLAFTSLLLRTNVQKALGWSAENYQISPNDPRIATTYALALQLTGRTKEGLAILEKLDSSVLQQPDTALYYGILLAANGDTNRAKIYLQLARTKTEFLPEEKQLLSAADKP